MVTAVPLDREHDAMVEVAVVAVDGGGVMVTAVPLDREHHAMVEVAVVAVDGGGRSDIATVRVAISDVNDNAPEFYFPEYHVCIPTNLSIDSVFLKVKARDKDTGTAGVVEYSIYNLQSKRVKHLFGINPQTGSIVLLQSVSQHERQHFQFFVRAADGGAPPLFSDVAVNVYVMRPEDTPPTFHRRDQRVFVPEHAPPGTVVAQVKLVTPMTVEYKLLSNSTQFSIDSKGLITLTSALDRELSPSHTLGVLALKSPLSGFTEVYVIVVDINDNPPHFHSSTYNIRVAENVDEGTSIVRVSASDDDEGGAGEVRYSIASPVLTVDPYSGWVSVVSALDREVEPIHSAVLTATDNGDPALSSTAVLLLDIVDYNDSPPTFSERLYSVSVNESLPVGASVLQVVASDPDGAGLDYYITSGDPHYRFSLRSTGQLSLAQPLDRELVDSYTLNISVSDSKYVVHTTVIIHVLDVNDNQPRCLQPMLKTTVSEDAAPGTTVLTVPAEDADLNPQLRYHLTGTNAAHFYFNQITGELKTGVSLDREAVSEYSLVAHVLDRDTSGWECTSHVTIHVADVNDNAPVFSSSNYTAAVPVDYPPGSFVTILRAVDSDFGGSQVNYSGRVITTIHLAA
ncbi:fat-like cadherin-related tumor suppressor homolog [Macrosteles quadrilineatus]|uniref:fat-like cadherin-related tumor suppressor homolog n=1 Tax=Macrosteles quadrilineatus TaxID=74068 RepID=UPI0023E0B429|nr:fat-like cadherin-related tumor suppressor homolog [Macrosteles quadrilineatus]